jgi:hypothetical protein
VDFERSYSSLAHSNRGAVELCWLTKDHRLQAVRRCWLVSVDPSKIWRWASEVLVRAYPTARVAGGWWWWVWNEPDRGSRVNARAAKQSRRQLWLIISFVKKTMTVAATKRQARNRTRRNLSNPRSPDRGPLLPGCYGTAPIFFPFSRFCSVLHCSSPFLCCRPFIAAAVAEHSKLAILLLLCWTNMSTTDIYL